MSYTTPDLNKMAEKIKKKVSGIYISYDRDMFEAISYLSKVKGITPESVGILAFKTGILQLLEEVSN